MELQFTLMRFLNWRTPAGWVVPEYASPHYAPAVLNHHDSTGANTVYAPALYNAVRLAGFPNTHVEPYNPVTGVTPFQNFCIIGPNATPLGFTLQRTYHNVILWTGTADGWNLVYPLEGEGAIGVTPCTFIIPTAGSWGPYWTGFPSFSAANTPSGLLTSSVGRVSHKSQIANFQYSWEEMELIPPIGALGASPLLTRALGFTCPGWDPSVWGNPSTILPRGIWTTTFFVEVDVAIENIRANNQAIYFAASDKIFDEVEVRIGSVGGIIMGASVNSSVDATTGHVFMVRADNGVSSPRLMGGAQTVIDSISGLPFWLSTMIALSNVDRASVISPFWF